MFRIRIRIRVRIHRIHLFLGLLDPSIIMQKSKKNLDSYYFVTLLEFMDPAPDPDLDPSIIMQK